jgi:hypothetical protein
MIEIVRYNAGMASQWDQFIESSINGTFLHSRAFFNHNPLNQEDDYSFVFLENNMIIGLLPANKYSKDGRVVLNSFLRSTYGGFVIGNDVGVADMIHIVELLKQNALDNNIDVIIIRPSFSIYHIMPANHIEYALWLNGFTLKCREIEIAIPIVEDYHRFYESSTTRSIKKAIKSGVSINESGDLHKYWEVLTRNLQEKHNTKPVHTIEEIVKLIELVGHNRVKLFTAEYNGETIGGILVFFANKKVAHAQYIAANTYYQEMRPLNLIIDHIVKWCLQRNFTFFNLGMACEPDGLELNAGLCRFKEGFGGRWVLRETMQIALIK